LQPDTDTEDIERPDIWRSPPNPQSQAEAEQSIEVTGVVHQSSRLSENLQYESTQGLKAKADTLADRLAVHEQTHQEIAKVLEREEKKLDERRKQAGGNIIKLKRITRDIIELNALKQFNNVRIEYQRKREKDPNLKLCPSLKASTVIARQFGKSKYYARSLREKSAYLHRVGELQISKRGKGAAHQSLLLEPRVVTAIQAWVKGAIPAEKGGYTGRVWCDALKRDQTNSQ
jgi:hypothetical protein